MLRSEKIFGQYRWRVTRRAGSGTWGWGTISLGEMIRRLVLVRAVYDPEEMVNRVEFL
jgi:hypothetical protein